jgi:hypothetical protein
VRNKYSTHYEQYIEKKQLRERSRKLAADVKKMGITQQQVQEYEQLHALREKGVYQAQQQCRKFRTGKKLVTKNHNTGSQSTILKVSMQLGIRGQGYYMDTTVGIVTKLKEAMARWRQYSKVEAEEDRKTFLQNEATAIAEEKNTTMQKTMKQLPLREDKNGLQLKSRWFGANCFQEAFP